MKTKLLLLLLMFSYIGYSQYNIATEDGNTINTCSATLVDSGGIGGDYLVSENYSVTFCSTTPGQTIQIDFTVFDTESGFDFVNVYDGNSTVAPLLASYSGNTIPAAVIGTTSNVTDCLTIEFVSDSIIVDAGFEASISCAAPVAGPITMQNGSSTTCSGTFVDSGGTGGSYSANENFVYTICPSTAGQAIELDFTSFQTDSQDYMVVYDGNVVDFNTVIGTYNGFGVTTPFLVTATTNNASGCLTITFNSDSNGFEDTGWLANISCVSPVSPPACQGTSSGTSTAGCPSVIAGGAGLGDVDPANITCGSGGCTDIEATYLDLGDTSDYRVESIPYAPPYQFDCLKVPVSVGQDDVWSPPVNLPFDFCFYGNTYNQCLIGSNGTITFDLTNNTPGGAAGYSFANDLPSTVGDLFANTIYGVYHDINPSVGGEVGYELITLDTGCRALIVAWHDVPMFSDNSILYTGMMVLYENTNVIEVYIEEKNIDNNDVAPWNDGNAIVGIQNVGATQSVVAPGRNGLDTNWNTTTEAWRFVPDGASITSLAWYEGNTPTGPVIGTTDTLNVCPAVTTTYTAEVTYTLCDGSVITDTELTTVTVDSCPSTSIDFDGTDDYVDANSFMGGFGAATQMSWVRLDANFGSGGGPVTGNANTAVGGQNSANAIGTILAAGTGASTANSLRINNGNPSTTLTLDHTVPAGTNITISIARDTNAGDVTISDGTASQGFSAGPNDVLQHITFTTGQATNTLTITRNGGGVWVDGVEYSYTVSGTSGMVMGQSNNKLYINADGTLTGEVKTDTGTFMTTTVTSLTNGVWAHVASIYDGSTLKLYINGSQEASVATGGTVLDVNSNRYAVGRDAELNDKFLHGFIQESRVYDVALTDVQLQEQVYQQIENNGGNVHGSSIPKDIDGGSLSWSNLILYLKLNNVAAGLTTDDSNTATTATLVNMTTAQVLSAPIPYVANASGTWTNTGTWQYGSDWDVTSLPNKDWMIIQVTNNAKVTSTASHTHLGLLVDSGSELEIQNDQLLNNTSYIKLDGQIDLEGESQLIQTTSSDLDVTSAGYLERDQDGKSNLYQYNYWSSPVGNINNTVNNQAYSVAGILRDGTTPTTPQAISFIGGYDGAPGSPISLAEFWVFRFIDSPDAYANWTQPLSSGTFQVGEGFTLKGSGAASTTQNYTFNGKPNNGVIQHTIGGNNKSLLGNPYPSALDADAFINANIGANPSTTGALYFWEHWGGTSHLLAAYEGGYATYNLLGGVLAISDPMVSSNGSGTLAPQQYVPVAQGFMVQGDPDGGTVDFTNAQRVFEKESGGNSTFIRSAEENEDVTNANSEAAIDKVYFTFTTPEGPTRQLLLGVKEGLTEGVEYGYDAKRFNEQHTDCGWGILEESYVIQGIGSIYTDLELPLLIKVGTAGECQFNVDDLTDLEENIEVYFKDAELQTETRLEVNQGASVVLEAGDYTNRFSVVFKVTEREIEEVTEVEEIAANNLVVYYNTQLGAISIANPTKFEVSKIRVYNVLGQEVLKHNKQYQEVTEVLLPVQVATGGYLVQFVYNNEIEVTKKIIIQ